MKPVKPMEPKKSDEIPRGSEWTAQIKWDGVRVLTYYDGNNVRLFNRKCNERTLHFPELTDIPTYCDAGTGVILDGEVIAMGDDGKPSFHEVMRRDGIRRMERVEQVKKLVPVTYMVFDVLYYNGEWKTNSPLEERLALLSRIIKTADIAQQVSSHEDGDTLFKVVRQHGMEGIVMKRIDSPYILGKKKDVWLKIKNYRDLIAVIGGYTLRGSVVNAVLLGLYDSEGKLWYIGHTGTGKMTHNEWVELTESLSKIKLEKRPFHNVPPGSRKSYWVNPQITVKVKFSQWTEGMSLRQPSIEAFVEIPPENCRFEQGNLHHGRF